MASEDVTLEDVFLMFANHGHTHGDDHSHLDNRQWVKLCKDTGIISKKSAFTSTDADILFAKVKASPTERRIAFHEFRDALEDASRKVFPDIADLAPRIDAIHRLVISSGGPAARGVTKPDPGTPYDEIERHESERKDAMHRREKRRSRTDEDGGVMVRAETFTRGSAKANSAGGDPLKRAWLNFAHGFGHDAAAALADMDVNRYIRMLRDCGLLARPRAFSATQAELGFTKVCTRGAKKIGFEQSCDALRELAAAFFADESPAAAYAHAADMIIATGGPVAAAATTADSVRLADDIAKQEAERKAKDDRREKRRSGVDAVNTTAVASETFARTTEEALRAEPGTLKAVFLEFGAFSHTHGSTAAELDNVQWIKLLTDCGLLKHKKRFDRTAADLLFARVKSTGSRRIGFPEFNEAVRAVGAALHKSDSEDVAYGKVAQQIIDTGGPAGHGATAAETPDWAKAKAHREARK